MGPVRPRLVFSFACSCTSCMPSVLGSGLLVSFLVLSLLMASTASAHPLTIVESDSRHLSINLEEVTVQWQEIQLRNGEVLLFDPLCQDIPTGGKPGAVRTPVAGGWLLVPPGTVPRIASREENWVSAGNRPLMVQAIPVLTKDALSGLASMSEMLVLSGEEIPADAPVPLKVRQELGNRSSGFSGSALELGDITWWRGHRLISWHLNLIRHDGRLAQDMITGGSWDIVFEADKQQSISLPAGHETKVSNQNDQHFSGFLLNDNLLDSLPTEAGFHGAPTPAENKNTRRGGKSGTLLGSVEGRLSVAQTRLYRVTAERLRSLGYLPDQDVAESQIRLYQRRYLDRLDDGSGDAPYVEIEVPIHMVGQGDLFSGDDFFIFHGQRLRDDVDFIADVGQGEENISGCGDNFEMNNNGNYYWVAASEPDAGQSWARMGLQSLPAASAAPLDNYRRVEHHQEQVAYRQSPLEITEDRLFMNHFMSTEVSVGFSPLWSPDPNGTTARVEFQIAGFGATMVEQNLDVELVTDNTLITPLPTCVVDDNVLEERFYDFSPAALDGSTSKLVFSQNGSRLFSWLNWVELQYDALYQAVGNSLTWALVNLIITNPLWQPTKSVLWMSVAKILIWWSSLILISARPSAAGLLIVRLEPEAI